MSDSSLITSKDIIEKTGISRATLNNYIKLGILPKPIVRRPGPEEKGVKQIGYFPADVLERILKVKLLKQQGNSMEDIAQMFQDKGEDDSDAETQDVIEKVNAIIEHEDTKFVKEKLMFGTDYIMIMKDKELGGIKNYFDLFAPLPAELLSRNALNFLNK